MAPPLSNEQEKILFDIYYKQKMFFGRDRLFQYIKKEYPDSKISRRQIMDYLKKQKNWQENYIPRKKKSTKAVLTLKAGYLQIDLIDFQRYADNGFKFILTAMDLFTKKASAIPLKNKSGKSVAEGIKKLLEKYEKVSVIQSDNGSEFLSPEVKTLLDNKGIKRLYSKAYSPQTQGTIERFNQTLERLIEKLFNYKDKNRWVKDLDELVDNYNKTVHYSTKETPDNIEQNQDKVKERLQSKYQQNPQNTKNPDYKVGDRVKVRLKKTTTDKKGTKTFTVDNYTVHKVLKSRKPYVLNQYKLKDKDGDLISGYYNSTELLLIKDDIQEKKRKEETQPLKETKKQKTKSPSQERKRGREEEEGSNKRPRQ